jgi:hypothetical protein
MAVDFIELSFLDVNDEHPELDVFQGGTLGRSEK